MTANNVLPPSEHIQSFRGDRLPTGDSHGPSPRRGRLSSKVTPRVLLAWHRFGPYHHARAAAAAARFHLTALEISSVDFAGDWTPLTERPAIPLQTLCPGENVDEVPIGILRVRLARTLSRLRPDVVAVHGYATRSALLLIEYALAHACPIVLMSDSTDHDKPRQVLRERVKARVVRLAAAGLTSGRVGAAYLARLGLPEERVFLGYDTVDNSHFSRPRRSSAPALGQAEKPYFLASARFIEAKNHLRLLDAYAHYRLKCLGPPFDLVILGDGAFRPRMTARISSLGLSDFVSLPGFKEYDELPDWYAAAACLIQPSISETWGLVVNEAMAAGLPVLVSNRCGCAPELVREGVNGFTFDPYNVESIAELMHRMAHGNVDRLAMGRASQEIIADWGPERFADGLESAARAALAAPLPQPAALDKALLWALLQR